MQTYCIKSASKGYVILDLQLIAYESRMSALENLKSALDSLHAQRSQVAEGGWCLQHCWLVQVKPGGTARTNCKYWQVRSRQPLFNGKTLKHLKPDEVEDYRAAIERGQKLKLLDRQIEKLQQQLAQLISNADSSKAASTLLRTKSGKRATDNSEANPTNIMAEKAQNQVKLDDIAEQERIVEELLYKSQLLRASLRQAVAIARQLGAKNIDLRKQPL
jgi:hypothetical protein